MLGLIAPITPKSPTGQIGVLGLRRLGVPYQMVKKLKPNNGMLTAQELAERTREPYDTINHWARMRLLPYQKRGKTRSFPERESIARCKKIRDLQNEDLNLAAIRRMLSSDR